ncbi:MAG TPA: transposase [Solirubrobacteraceae bacterium]|nr:transposase [Solirubrobacteraceae bacterium]
MELAIPCLRRGSYFPRSWSPAGQRAMVPVVAQADMAGVSTRRVERLVPSLGSEGISPSLVSEMARELDQLWRPFAPSPWTPAPIPTCGSTP